MPSIIAVIPAKTTSHRIQNKNTRDLCGRALYMYAVDNCVEAGCFETRYLSSDGILDTNLKATLHNRQIPLCGDVPASQVAVEVLRDMYDAPWRMPEWTCLCQPTSPCLLPATLARAAKFCEEDQDAIIAFSPLRPYRPCGAFYFMRSYLWLNSRPFDETIRVLDDSDRLLWYLIDRDEAVDVDCYRDWYQAENILKGRANTSHIAAC